MPKGNGQRVHILARTRLGQQDRIRMRLHDADEIILPVRRVERVDAHHKLRPRGPCLRFLDVVLGQRARRRLACCAHRVLQIEDQAVGTGGEALGQLFFIVSRNEQKRTHVFDPHAVGRLRIMPWRRHSATSSPR
jgi:hypothetical protein